MFAMAIASMEGDDSVVVVFGESARESSKKEWSLVKPTTSRGSLSEKGSSKPYISSGGGVEINLVVR